MSEPRLHVLDDPAAAVGELLADQARARRQRSSSPAARASARAYERAARGRAGLAPRLALVGRRALRPARRRALELRPGPADAARPARTAARGAPDPRRARPRRGGGASTTRALAGVDARPAPARPRARRPRRLALPGLAAARRARRPGDAAGRPALEPFVERVTMTLPTLLAARADRPPRRRAPPRRPRSTRAFGGEIDPEAARRACCAPGEAPIEVYCDRGRRPARRSAEPHLRRHRPAAAARRASATVDPAPASERAQHEHGVGDRHVLEVGRRALERARARRSIARRAPGASPARERRERVGDRRPGSRRGPRAPAASSAGLRPAPEHEQRERRRVAADRRGGLGAAELERPARVAPPRRRRRRAAPP